MHTSRQRESEIGPLIVLNVTGNFSIQGDHAFQIFKVIIQNPDSITFASALSSKVQHIQADEDETDGIPLILRLEYCFTHPRRFLNSNECNSFPLVRS